MNAENRAARRAARDSMPHSSGCAWARSSSSTLGDRGPFWGDMIDSEAAMVKFLNMIAAELDISRVALSLRWRW
jgi:hypothetical protein